MRRKSIVWIVAVTAVILAIPLVAMQFSEEVDWTGSDFVAMGTFLIAMGLIYEFLATRRKDRNYRLVVGAGTLLATLAIWVGLATG